MGWNKEQYWHEQELKKDPEYQQFYGKQSSNRGDGGFDYQAAAEYEREQMMKDPTVLRSMEAMNLAIKDKDFLNSLDSKTQKALQERTNSGEQIRGISNFQEKQFFDNFHKKFAKHDAGITNYNSANDVGNVYFKQGEMIRDNHNANFAHKDDLNSTAGQQDGVSQQSAEAGSTTEIATVEDMGSNYGKYMRQPFEGDVFGGTNRPSAEGDHGENRTNSNGDSQRSGAASNFLSKYKLNLLDKLNLKAQIS